MTYRFRGRDLRITRNETGGIVHYLLEDVERGVRHRLYDLEYQTAQLLDGKRSTDKVAKLAARKLGLQAEPVDIDRFARQLLALDFVIDEE